MTKAEQAEIKAEEAEAKAYEASSLAADASDKADDANTKQAHFLAAQAQDRAAHVNSLAAIVHQAHADAGGIDAAGSAANYADNPTQAAKAYQTEVERHMAEAICHRKQADIGMATVGFLVSKQSWGQGAIAPLHEDQRRQTMTDKSKQTEIKVGAARQAYLLAAKTCREAAQGCSDQAEADFLEAKAEDYELEAELEEATAKFDSSDNMKRCFHCNGEITRAQLDSAGACGLGRGRYAHIDCIADDVSRGEKTQT